MSERGHARTRVSPKPTRVLRARLHIDRDEDQGPCSGAWALDTLTVHLSVYRDAGPAGRLTYVARVDGRWRTFRGARSPQHCVVQRCDGSGRIRGFLAGRVGGELNVCGPLRRSYDLGGTRRNILKPLAAQQARPSLLNAIQVFLGTPTVSVADFAADYYVGSRIVWTNRPSGNTGDVVVPCAASTPARARSAAVRAVDRPL